MSKISVEFTIERADTDPENTLRTVLTVRDNLTGKATFMLIGDPESEEGATARGHRVREHFCSVLVELGYITPQEPN